MQISVAMATFQGERFLAEQLASIRNQILPPAELVIQDDASTDGTVVQANNFSANVPFPVRVETNRENSGSTTTFEGAIRRCAGEVIVLADQDDVWLPQKLERIHATFSRDPKLGFAFSNADVVDKNRKPKGYRLWDAIGFSSRERKRFGFATLLRRNRVTGATLAFHSRFRDLLLPIPTKWHHDAWIALLLSAIAPCVAIDEPLILYRQHANQQIGGDKRSFGEQFRKAQHITAETYRDVRDRFEEARQRLSQVPGVRSEVLRALQEKCDHFDRRAKMRNTRLGRSPAIFGELCRGRYFRYSRGWASALQDLFLP